MEGYLKKWEQKLSIILHIYLESLEDNTEKIISIFNEDNNDKVEELSHKINVLYDLELIKIGKFLEDQMAHSQKIKHILGNSHKKIKDYFESINR